MSRIYRDTLLGRDLRVPSRRELIAASNLEVLKEKGIEVHDVHCECCGLKLTDLGKIKFSGRVIGPECSKRGHGFPCKDAKAKPPELELEQFHGRYRSLGDLALNLELSGRLE